MFSVRQRETAVPSGRMFPASLPLAAPLPSGQPLLAPSPLAAPLPSLPPQASISARKKYVPCTAVFSLKRKIGLLPDRQKKLHAICYVIVFEGFI
jgi:hypothetical protein